MIFHLREFFLNKFLSLKITYDRRNNKNINTMTRQYLVFRRLFCIFDRHNLINDRCIADFFLLYNPPTKTQPKFIERCLIMLSLLLMKYKGL